MKNPAPTRIHRQGDPSSSSAQAKSQTKTRRRRAEPSTVIRFFDPSGKLIERVRAPSKINQLMQQNAANHGVSVQTWVKEAMPKKINQFLQHMEAEGGAR